MGSWWYGNGRPRVTGESRRVGRSGADRIVTARLELAALAVSDAEEMVAVLGDEGLHAFSG